MKKILITNNQNVKTMLAFSSDSEIFQLSNSGSDRPFEISKGIAEKNRPLPIINALSVRFFEQLNNNLDSLLPDSLPDENVIINLIESAYEDIGIDYKSAFYREIISNPNFLIQNQIKNDSVSIPLTYELIELFYYCWKYINGDRAINWEFYKLRMTYKREFERKYNNCSINPDYIYNKRIEEVNTLSGSIVTLSKNTLYEKVKVERLKKLEEISNSSELAESFTIEEQNKFEEEAEKLAKMDRALTTKRIKELTSPQQRVVVGVANNPLSFAWYEIFIAEFLRGKYSLCTFCGKIFCLEKMPGNAINKSTCSDECNKKLRKQRDLHEKEKNPDKVRKLNNLRKNRSTAYQEILSGHCSIEECIRKYNFDSDDFHKKFNSHKKKKAIELIESGKCSIKESANKFRINGIELQKLFEEYKKKHKK